MSFSILMSVYHRDSSEYLDQALKSIWDEQTLRPSQIVIVKDGGLNAGLAFTIEQWKSRLNDVLTIVDLENNVGLGAALNEGLKYCQCELVARMDADDVCAVDRMEKQISFMDANPDIDILGGYATEIDFLGRKGGTRKMPLSHSGIVDALWLCPLIHPTVMFRRDEIVSLGGYDSRLRRRQDYELWFRCAKAGLRFSNLPEVLLYYRFDSLSHNKQPAKLALLQGKIGFKGATELGLPIWKRLACFIPFLRSLLPRSIQHSLYRVMRRFDPRQA